MAASKSSVLPFSNSPIALNRFVSKFCAAISSAFCKAVRGRSLPLNIYSFVNSIVPNIGEFRTACCAILSVIVLTMVFFSASTFSGGKLYSLAMPARFVSAPPAFSSASILPSYDQSLFCIISANSLNAFRNAPGVVVRFGL